MPCTDPEARLPTVSAEKLKNISKVYLSEMNDSIAIPQNDMAQQVSEFKLIKTEVLPVAPDQYLPLIIRESDKPIFTFNKDGEIIADWQQLRKMYDDFINGSRDAHVILAAAIWKARNS